MSTLHLDPGSHVGLAKPDSRSRFPLGKWITRQPVAGWRTYRLDDGKTIVLEAIEESA